MKKTQFSSINSRERQASTTLPPRQIPSLSVSPLPTSGSYPAARAASTPPSTHSASVRPAH